MSCTGLQVLDEQSYHADPCPEPSLSASIAKILINGTPAQAYMQHPRLNPDYAPQTSDAFDIGSACHAMLLEGEGKVIELDFPNWRTNASKDARNEARRAGKIPLLAKDAKRVRAMHKEALRTLHSNTDFGYELSDGNAEQTILWQEDGTWMRSRIDWLSKDYKIILDYKTEGQSANPFQWSKSIIKNGYEIQAAFYRRAVQSIEPTASPKFIFLAQEKTPPYVACLIGLPDSWIDLGDDKVREAKQIWDRCVSTKKWPGYGNRIYWPDVPQWAATQWDDYLLSQNAQKMGKDDLPI